MISRDFVRWITLAALIAGPITYLGLDLLLRQIPYRASQSLFAYGLGFFIPLLLALVIVNAITVRAARPNLVDALRTE